MNAPGVKLHEANEGAEYHAISPLAVSALVVGLISPVALIAALLWIVPVLAIALACLALRAIAASGGALTGRVAALAGLALGVIFAAAGPVQSATTRYLLVEQARPICDAWFDFLRNGEPHKAHQLMEPALRRKALDDRLWEYYRASSENREALEQFVASPIPRAILEYGHDCQIRFYDTVSVTPAGDGDVVELLYAVTCPIESARQTFFALLVIDRRQLQNGDVTWRIVRANAGAIPTGSD